MLVMNTRLSLYIFCLITIAILPALAQQDQDQDKSKKKKTPIPEKRMEIIGPLPSGVYEGKTKLPWRLYVPEGAKDGEPLPLVIGLHGAGARGDDNYKAMAKYMTFIDDKQQEKFPAYVLAPQIANGRSWVVHGQGGYKNEDFANKEPREEMETLFALVEETIKNNNIDPNRVYITGQSMGGFGTWDALMRRPDLWAAAVPICGGGDPSQVAKYKDIPIWVWHGSEDKAVPVENSRELVAALKKAGGNPKYDEPKVGHPSWNKAYKTPELYVWMFEQKRTDK